MCLVLERKAAEIVQNSESEGSVYNSNVKFREYLVQVSGWEGSV